MNSKQCTIVWYVDDLKVSHEDEHVVKKIMDKIANKFGELNSKIGNEQKYLGMDINFNGDGTVSIQMDDYIKEVISTFDEQSHVTSATNAPALHNLFMVDTTSPRLDTNRSETFHHCVAKLLYITKRCRLDILTTISFLCTRVTGSTGEDWQKSKRLTRYLYGSTSRQLRIGANDITLVNVFIDAGYAAHPDMKSHTGGCIFFC